MKFFSRIVAALLLITTSTASAYTTNDLPHHVFVEVSQEPIRIPDLRTLSYDEVVNLLALLESDSFEEKYSEVIAKVLWIWVSKKI